MKNFVFFILLLLANACQGQTRENALVIQKALNIDAATKYFHPKLKSRNPYYLLTNQYITNGVNLTIHGNTVYMADSAKINTKNYIKITKFLNKHNTIRVDYFYKIENILVSVILKKINGGWCIKTHKIIQF